MTARSMPTTILWLLAIVLLGVRTGDAHLHMCLDGLERLITLHVADAPLHHAGTDSADGHNDQDLDLSDSAIIKKSADLDDLPLGALIALVVVLLLPGRRSVLPHFPASTPALVSAFHIRPPLRGPPR